MDTTTKNNLLNKIIASHKDMLTFIDSLDPEQMTSITNENGWSVKDFIIHLAKWETGIVYLLQRKSRREGMGIPQQIWENWDTNKINQHIYETYKNIGIDGAIDLLKETNKAIIDVLRDLTIDDLMKPYNHFDKDVDFTDPVIGWINGNTFGHFKEHLVKLKELVEE